MFLYTYIAHLILLDHVLVWVTIEQHTEKVYKRMRCSTRCAPISTVRSVRLGPLRLRLSNKCRQTGLRLFGDDLNFSAAPSAERNLV